MSGIQKFDLNFDESIFSRKTRNSYTPKKKTIDTKQAKRNDRNQRNKNKNGGDEAFLVPWAQHITQAQLRRGTFIKRRKTSLYSQFSRFSS